MGRESSKELVVPRKWLVLVVEQSMMLVECRWTWEELVRMRKGHRKLMQAEVTVR